MALTVPICVQPVLPSADRSILKIVSLLLLSVQFRVIWLPEAVALNPLGAADPTGDPSRTSSICQYSAQVAS